MILGSKPLSEMSDDELIAAIEELRSAREALRDTAIKSKAKGDPLPKAPRAAKPEDAKLADIMREFLEGDE